MDADVKFGQFFARDIWTHPGYLDAAYNLKYLTVAVKYPGYMPGYLDAEVKFGRFFAQVIWTQPGDLDAPYNMGYFTAAVKYPGVPGDWDAGTSVDKEIAKR